MHGMALTCGHVGAADLEVAPSDPDGCHECLETGDRWVHLRLCAICGHVGCCDSSPNRHATAHFHGSGHPLIRSYERGEDFWYCYPDDAMFQVEGIGPVR
jgi:CPA2 family monovalent cation:H+ antiporter-2